ncbi:MAG: hypothetical protein JXB07_14530 [Anaerolineae bacterium]|nr:hypothetical protein [Anaerolineae bacterium]
MTLRISRATLSTLVIYTLFAVVVIYMLQARFTEKPSILVDHFMAGAGSLSLFVLCPLGMAAGLLPLVAWPVPSRPGSSRLHLIAMALPIIIMFAAMIGLERRAPQYNYETFERLVATYESGSVVTREQALELLGAPLSREQIDEREVWSYTYMPSTGFGWHKRILVFDETGQMVAFTNFDEP